MLETECLVEFDSDFDAVADSEFDSTHVSMGIV